VQTTLTAVKGPSAMVGEWRLAHDPEVVQLGGGAGSGVVSGSATDDPSESPFAYYSPHAPHAAAAKPPSSSSSSLRFSEPAMLVMPPLNFSMVSAGVYRGGYPKSTNYGFLRKLGLRSMLNLMHKEYDNEVSAFARAHGITLFHRAIGSNKEPFLGPDLDQVVEVLRVVLDRKNHPIYVHCTKGQHRTGCLMGCLRKLQSWSLSSIFQEYTHFAGRIGGRPLDCQFIELFPCSRELQQDQARWEEEEERAFRGRRAAQR